MRIQITPTLAATAVLQQFGWSVSLHVTVQHIGAGDIELDLHWPLALDRTIVDEVAAVDVARQLWRDALPALALRL